MQQRLFKTAVTFGMGLIAGLVATDIAAARGGGGGNVMNSPGYQRRLQESRGFVTSYSNGYAQRGPLYDYRHPQAQRRYLRPR